MGPTAGTHMTVKRNHKNYTRQALYSTYNVTLRHIQAIIVGNGKAMSIIYFKCVFIALCIQHAMRMCLITLPSVPCPAVPHFPTLSHKRYDFRGKVTEHKMCVLVFCTSFV